MSSYQPWCSSLLRVLWLLWWQTQKRCRYAFQLLSQWLPTNSGLAQTHEAIRTCDEMVVSSAMG